MSTDKKFHDEKVPDAEEIGATKSDFIEDFSLYKEGDVFPPLNKKIHILMVNQENYIVFLDEQLYVHRYYNAHYGEGGLAKDYSEIIIRQSNLESTSMLLLKNSPLEVEVFRRLLGESIARLLEDRDSENANVMLDKAEVFLTARSRERARVWYLSASLIATAVVIVVGILLWTNRSVVAARLGLEVGAIDVMLGAVAGSLGALISILLRSDELKTDVSAGRRIHYFEGVMRILVGVMAGLLFALTIKSNILLGTVNRSEQALPILLVVSIIAGASERLLPSLIKQLEGTLVKNVQEVQVVTVDGGGQEKEVGGQDTPAGAKKRRRSILFRRKSRDQP